MKKPYTLQNFHQNKQAGDYNLADHIDDTKGNMKPKESTLRSILDYSKSLYVFACKTTDQKELMVMN